MSAREGEGAEASSASGATPTAKPAASPVKPASTPEPPALGRALPSVNRAAGLQHRISRVLGLALALSVGLGLLGWYYSHVFRHGPVATPRGAVRTTEGEMALPPLDAGAIAPRRSNRTTLSGDPDQALTASANPSSYVIGSVVGDRPSLGSLEQGESFNAGMDQGGMVTPATATPPVDRRFTGAVFVSAGGSGVTLSHADGSPEAATPEVAEAGAAVLGEAPATGASAASFSQQIRTPLTPAVVARRVPTMRLLLARGAFIDCTLETAVDSSLPGLVTCLTATDTFGADGHVVLLERGTTLVGETRGEVRAGVARVYIVWTEARTPTGVVAALDSPATDALGRSGVGGHVERHFWERFGAAMLLSIIDGAVQAAASGQGNGTTVVAGGSATSEILGEVLKSTVNIAPTVTIPSGTRVQALVARDIDFRRVYALRAAASGP